MNSQLSLPLFPLNTVLFPGQVLPLHVFEPRYRKMIATCIEQGAPFGVALIQDSEQVGGPTKPYEVGTTARITQVERLDDASDNLPRQAAALACLTAIALSRAGRKTGLAHLAFHRVIALQRGRLAAA